MLLAFKLSKLRVFSKNTILSENSNSNTFIKVDLDSSLQHRSNGQIYHNESKLQH